MDIIEIIKAIIVGVVEGITEWLPVSSTGHIILTDAFLPLNVSESFKEMFDVVIQLGAIFAVILLFWNKLWPLTRYRESTGVVTMGKMCAVKKSSVRLWIKVIIACIPSILIGLPFDDWLDEHLYNPTVVSIMLIVYGFIASAVNIIPNLIQGVTGLILGIILINIFNKNKIIK